MKIIISIVRPEKLPDVKSHLQKGGVGMMTIIDVRGCGQQKGYPESFRGVIEEVDLHRKVMILTAVNDSFVDSVIKAVMRGARTGRGNVGDGKIFILPLEDCIRIRTGEAGVAGIGGKSKELEKFGRVKTYKI
jgi:nitrogen regulatory protein P-II 2